MQIQQRMRSPCLAKDSTQRNNSTPGWVTTKCHRENKVGRGVEEAVKRGSRWPLGVPFMKEPKRQIRHPSTWEDPVRQSTQCVQRPWTLRLSMLADLRAGKQASVAVSAVGGSGRLAGSGQVGVGGQIIQAMVGTFFFLVTWPLVGRVPAVWGSWSMCLKVRRLCK